MLSKKGYIGLMCKILVLMAMPRAGAQDLTARKEGLADKYWHITKVELAQPVRTRQRVLDREMMFKEGDSVSFVHLELDIWLSEALLMNTLLFHSVKLTPTYDSLRREVAFKLELDERWSLLPKVEFKLTDRNLNAWLNDPDLRRITVGAQLTEYNAFGQRIKLRGKGVLGWRRAANVLFEVPYLGKNGDYTLAGEYLYEKGKEIGYNTLENKYLYFRDPEFIVESHQSVMSVTRRVGSRQEYQIDLASRHTWLNEDRINTLNYNYLEPGRHEMNLYTVTLGQLYNGHDRAFYPLSGFTQQFEVGGWRTSNGLSSLFLKESFAVYGKKVLGLPIYTAHVSRVHVQSQGALPYLLRTPFGFDYTVRGYETLAIEGRHSFLQMNEVKYLVFQRDRIVLPLVPWKDFKYVPLRIYVKGLADFGKVWSAMYATGSNPLHDRWLYSVGVGVDVVTYYDNVFRLEGCWNETTGWGIFVHVKEIF